MSTFPQNGEIWYVDLPNQPGDPHQPRTALIVSTDGRNKSCNDVMVVPTTSSAKFSLHPLVHVEIPAGEGGLPKNSVVRCDQVVTLDKKFLKKGPLGGLVSLKYRWKVIDGVRAALGDTRV